MRRPTAIFRRGSDFAEFLAARDLLTYTKPRQNFRGEMPINRKKFPRLTRTRQCQHLAVELVTQNHHRPVIKRPLIVSQRVHLSLERRADRAASLHQQINSQVNRSPLVNWTPAPK